MEKTRGPATVVFQDGKVVFVRHGGIFVRVSPNRLSKGDKMKSLTETDRLNSEKSDTDIDQDKGKDSTDFHVSETLLAIMVIYMYNAPGLGQMSPWGPIFFRIINIQSYCPFPASLSLKMTF